MPLLWLLPAVIALIGMFAVAATASRAGDEARGLRRELGRFSELRPALVELGHATSDIRQTAEALRQR
jgi:hypothetical protein